MNIIGYYFLAGMKTLTVAYGLLGSEKEYRRKIASQAILGVDRHLDQPIRNRYGMRWKSNKIDGCCHFHTFGTLSTNSCVILCEVEDWYNFNRFSKKLSCTAWKWWRYNDGEGQEIKRAQRKSSKTIPEIKSLKVIWMLYLTLNLPNGGKYKKQGSILL